MYKRQVYLSAAPNSNALYKAYETAKKDALEMLDEPVPVSYTHLDVYKRQDVQCAPGHPDALYRHFVLRAGAGFVCADNACAAQMCIRDRRLPVP